MPKSKQPTEHKPLPKKRHRNSYNKGQDLTNVVCNVTGLRGGNGFDTGAITSGQEAENLFDCLEEMASAQIQTPTSAKTNDGSANADHASKATGIISLPPRPPPPGMDKIPNLRVELSRHLQIQSLSSFLLKSCTGLRMPTFERWLLDSKLEEKDRFYSISEEWVSNPAAKIACNENGNRDKGKRKKNRHVDNLEEEDARKVRQKDRADREIKMLLAAEKFLPSSMKTNAIENTSIIWRWVRHVDVDPILPWKPLQSDPSSERLKQEIVAQVTSSKIVPEASPEQRANEIVRELCDRSSEAWKEIQIMEQRFGKYQKFGWDASVEKIVKKRKRGGGHGNTSNSVDKVIVEWNVEQSSTEERTADDNGQRKKLCTIIYVPKKQKSSSNSDEKQPKPFVIKMNSTHYHKLRTMFDESYKNSDQYSSVTSSQATHAFHAALFASVIRYSSLSGGQQLNDLRGGGMQGAIHDSVFNCLSKWFGASNSSECEGRRTSGTECFSSPFNSTLNHYFSAFPSPDIDGHFGSYVSFRSGWYEVNPPFSPGIMMKMAHDIDKALTRAHALNLDVSFIIVIPTCKTDTSNRNKTGADEENDNLSGKRKGKKSKQKDKFSNSNDDTDNVTFSSTVHRAALSSFHRLINSPHCISHSILSAREHGYIEGSQHLRPTKFKESQYSTSVIVMRSVKCNGDGTIDWDTQRFEKDLREAFASRHSKEIHDRRRSLGVS
ncbi:hypothetical protein ACHAXS_011394 [Conticribra weissflogii]